MGYLYYQTYCNADIISVIIGSNQSDRNSKLLQCKELHVKIAVACKLQLLADRVLRTQSEKIPTGFHLLTCSNGISSWCYGNFIQGL